jgi:hypothetical protein
MHSAPQGPPRKSSSPDCVASNTLPRRDSRCRSSRHISPSDRSIMLPDKTSGRNDASVPRIRKRSQSQEAALPRCSRRLNLGETCITAPLFVRVQDCSMGCLRLQSRDGCRTLDPVGTACLSCRSRRPRVPWTWVPWTWGKAQQTGVQRDKICPCVTFPLHMRLDSPSLARDKAGSKDSAAASAGGTPCRPS